VVSNLENAQKLLRDTHTHARGHEIITLSCVVMKHEKCIKNEHHRSYFLCFFCFKNRDSIL